MTEFLAMGGYGVYVWSSYGLGLGIILLLAWQSFGSLRKAQRDVKAMEDLMAQRQHKGRDAVKAENAP